MFFFMDSISFLISVRTLVLMKKIFFFSSFQVLFVYLFWSPDIIFLSFPQIYDDPSQYLVFEKFRKGNLHKACQLVASL